jgi:anaerobic magnesium-protoporphyrin IX monomethyl ester cyclase
MIYLKDRPKRRKILLLNPPGDQPYLRDYYCSHSSKASYIWHPYDLLAHSGILGLEHDVEAFDPAVLRMSKAQARQEIQNRDFDTVLVLSGAVSLMEDFEFVQSVPGLTEKTFIVTGDSFLYHADELMEKFPFIDAMLLDFTSRCLLPYLRGELDGAPVPNLVYRDGDSVANGGRHVEKRTFEMPLPHYEIFPWKKYRIPHGRSFPFGSIITDFGCPYNCNFCVSGDLPYKWREIDDVMREFHYLRSLGIRELWIKDLTFFANRKHHRQLCEAMIEEDFGFGWVCLSRVNVVDEEKLELMARAGCHTIQFGVESPTEDILTYINKQTSNDQVRKIFKLCRRLGIRTLGHFVLGFPGETLETAKQTIDYAIELDCDYASFNVATPKVGTPFRAEAVAKGWVDSSLETVLDNSRSLPVVNVNSITPEQVQQMRNQAIKRFHIRPKYVWRRFRDAGSMQQLANNFRDAVALMRTVNK